MSPANMPRGCIMVKLDPANGADGRGSEKGNGEQARIIKTLWF